jgi:hypothetical protein
MSDTFGLHWMVPYGVGVPFIIPRSSILYGLEAFFVPIIYPGGASPRLVEQLAGRLE